MNKLLLILIIPFLLKGQNTYEFLRVDMSPRSAALGGSFVAANDDPNVIFNNPAGINYLKNTPVSFSFLKHLMDINFVSLSASHNFEGIGRFGLGLKYANYGSFSERDEFGNKLSDFSVNELAVIAGYGVKIDSNFYFGASGKLIYSGIASYSSTGAAIDLGFNYSIPSEELNIGVSILNIGGQLSSYVNVSEDLPLDVVIGLSKRLANLPVKLYLDFHKINENKESFFERLNTFTFGAEFILSQSLMLRLGYNHEKRRELKIGNFAGLAGFNAGFGLKISNYVFDYGFSSLGEIGSLHRIGINTEF